MHIFEVLVVSWPIIKPNIIQYDMIYKLKHVYYKIAQSYITYDVLKLLFIPYNATKSNCNV